MLSMPRLVIGMVVCALVFWQFTWTSNINLLFQLLKALRSPWDASERSMRSVR